MLGIVPEEAVSDQLHPFGCTKGVSGQRRGMTADGLQQTLLRWAGFFPAILQSRREKIPPYEEL
jgi:hypothetical protein